jgi:hypothetical protein
MKSAEVNLSKKPLNITSTKASQIHAFVGACSVSVELFVYRQRTQKLSNDQ